MGKNRIEAFSDGVFAIIITIMVLELKAPEGRTLDALQSVWPSLASYALSFVYVGIYWNNHHHMFQTVQRVTGGILWANLHLLFWLSLFPFVTGWLGETRLAASPAGVYGVVLMMAAIAYWVLQLSIIRHQGRGSPLAKAIGKDLKGKMSPVIYGLAIVASTFRPWISAGLYVLVALMWWIPDRRIERNLSYPPPEGGQAAD